MALPFDFQDPFGFWESGLGTRLTTDNYPVDMGQIQSGEGTQQWFQRTKFDVGRDFPERVDPESIITVFHAHSHSDIGGPGDVSVQFPQALRPFGEHLKNVPVSFLHHRKYFLDEVQRSLFMKQIAHGTDKDYLRFFPGERLV
jgi:hypothetical protein